MSKFENKRTHQDWTSKDSVEQKPDSANRQMLMKRLSHRPPKTGGRWHFNQVPKTSSKNKISKSNRYEDIIASNRKNVKS